MDETLVLDSLKPSLTAHYTYSTVHGFNPGEYRPDNISLNLVYGEVEYRFSITHCNQLLCGELFVNASTASSKNQGVPLFGYIRPAGGVRIMDRSRQAEPYEHSDRLYLGRTVERYLFRGPGGLLNR